MTMFSRCVAMALLGVSAPLYSQSMATSNAHTPTYIVPSQLEFAALIPEPPTEGSTAARHDLAAVRSAQTHRTVTTIAAAKRDADEEDIFIFATVFGPDFRAINLPLTAQFSAKLRNESGAVNPGLKAHFQRARPFAVDSAIHPVCPRTSDYGYPSGHAMVGWIMGLTLAQMIPERSDAILKRAQEYGGNRVVCGVHYPTDVEASHQVALALVGAMASSQAFQKDLVDSRQEIRRVLHLAAAANPND